MNVGLFPTICAIRRGKIVRAIKTETYQGAEYPYPNGFADLQNEPFDVIDVDLLTEGMRDEFIANHKP